VAVFDHPQNLRAPTYWHARAYGLLAQIPSAPGISLTIDIRTVRI